MTSYYKVPVLAIEHNNSIFSRRSTIVTVPRPAPRPLPWTKNDSFCGKEVDFMSVWPLTSWHPSWIQHQLVADFLRVAWTFQRNALCKSVISSSNDTTTSIILPGRQKLPPVMPEFNRTGLSIDYCLKTFSSATPHALKEASVHTKGGNWTLGEDVKGNGKPGWWINSPDGQGSSLTFSIKANATKGVLLLSYLTSYTEDMGTVEIFADGDASQSVTVNSKRDNRRVSLTETKRLCLKNNTSTGIIPSCSELAAKQIENSNPVYDIQPHAITIRLLPKKGPNKFKIYGLFSC